MPEWFTLTEKALPALKKTDKTVLSLQSQVLDFTLTVTNPVKHPTYLLLTTAMLYKSSYLQLQLN